MTPIEHHDYLVALLSQFADTEDTAGYPNKAARLREVASDLATLRAANAAMREALLVASCVIEHERDQRGCEEENYPIEAQCETALNAIDAALALAESVK